MTTYVALLRGINVGGRNRLPMADLRRLLSELGYQDVQTYVQSGNAVFTSDLTDPDAVAAEIRQQLADEVGMSPAVMIRTADQLAAVAAANPYAAEAEADPKKVHVAFLSTPPQDPSVFDFDADEYAPEQATLGERVVYLHLPDGMGRSRLAADLDKRRGEIDVTVRNWRTVTRLLEMAR